MKLFIRIAVVLVLLLVLAVAGLILFIDSAAKTAVERGGTYALGVDTALESASIGLFSGKFALNGLEVDNPEGFEVEHFFTLTNAGLEVSLPSLTKDTIEIPQLLIEGVTLDIERTSEGTNYGKILANLERFESGDTEGAEEPAKKEEGGRKFIIKEVVIRDVSATVKLIPIGGGATRIPIKLPEIVLRDVGTGGDGQSMSELFSTVLKGILGSVMKAGQGILPDDLLQDLGGQLQNLGGVAAEITQGVVSEAGDALKGATENVGEGAKKAGKKAGEALEDVKKGLGGLLKKD